MIETPIRGEDILAAVRILEQEADVQEEALRSAREAVTILTNRYKAGTVSYLNVAVVQAAALNDEKIAVEIRNRRHAACVLPIRALGGAWSAAVLPSNQAVLSGDYK